MPAKRSGRVLLWLPLLLASTGGNAELLADYDFDGDLSSAVGSPPDLEYLGDSLVFSDVTDGSGTRSVLAIELGSGLRLASVPGLSRSEFSVALTLRVDRKPGYQKLIDFRDRVSDTGFYVFRDFLFFFGVLPSPPYAAARELDGETFVQVILTRRASDGLTRVFLDGQEQFSFVDDSGGAEIGTEDTFHFLVDDTRFSSSENPEGQIDRLRVWSTALTDDEIRSLSSSGRLAVAPATELADYRFDETLASAVGSLPDLEYLGGMPTFDAGKLMFEEGTGFRLLADEPGALNNSTYTIALDVSLDTIDRNRKLIDFTGRVADEGLYLDNGFPVFDDFTPDNGIPVVAARDGSIIVLTREGPSKRVKTYVDGELRLSFLDEADAAVIGLTGELFFLVDDTTGAGAEHSAGAIDRLRIWDGALSATQVRDLGPRGPLVFEDGFEAAREEVTGRATSAPSRKLGSERKAPVAASAAVTAMPRWRRMARMLR